MPIPQDSPYRRAIDYGVFTILIVVFVVAIVRRVRRPIELEQDLQVATASASQSESASSEPASAVRPARPRRHVRLEPDRLPPPDLESPYEPFPDTETGSDQEPNRPPLSRRAVQVKINPNTATWWELCELPGIGEVKARAIVAFREEFRAEAKRENPRAAPPPAFEKPEDLDQVKGIGPATVEKMRPLLTFDRPAGRSARHR
jgi:DNA uptake protein ComE-like DNA-binding protein